MIIYQYRWNGNVPTKGYISSYIFLKRNGNVPTELGDVY